MVSLETIFVKHVINFISCTPSTTPYSHEFEDKLFLTKHLLAHKSMFDSDVRNLQQKLAQVLDSVIPAIIIVFRITLNNCQGIVAVNDRGRSTLLTTDRTYSQLNPKVLKITLKNCNKINCN